MPADWRHCAYLEDHKAYYWCNYLDDDCVREEDCKYFEDMRTHNHEQWQTDFSVCPDCGHKQLKIAKELFDKCENPDCETEVVCCPICTRKIWWNDNWDITEADA